ncbi:CRE-NHR-234 protein [Caenorhabditis remanei]|uniref:CRE-NHR-234 protein n=1 Tax=Caenorhabditis remanei TaxID=31234 RepID=E3MVF7_CAERE|nr:CRE-NHR-234 protein [Caenorhabditis remanei]
MVPSVNGLKKAPKSCLVCGITKASTHFGAVVCMACASFFRRTVSFNIRFLCRFSNQCRIAQDLRFICRSCRFDKCEAVGMQRHMVQAKRNDNKLPKYVLESRKEGVREVVRGYITSAYNTPGKSSILESSPEETSSEVGELERFSTILNVKHEELMLYYVKEIKNAMASREAAEVDLSETTLQQFISTKQRTDSLAVDICTMCPGTDLLETADIDILFRYCSFASLWMDSAWISASRQDLVNTEKSESEDILTAFIHQFQAAITTQLARLQLDIFEYAALKSFCIWKLGILDSTLTLKVVAGEQYFGITSALSNYYQVAKNMAPFEMATRLADITLLIAPIFNVYQDMLKVYHTLQIEDRFKEE